MKRDNYVYFFKQLNPKSNILLVLRYLFLETDDEIAKVLIGKKRQ